MNQSLLFIVEDEETISRLLEHWVTKRWGYTARIFSNGEECLDALGDDPDLILLDIMMPGMGGVETLKQIKKRDPELPVIILSAQSDITVAIESLKLGASDYFSKPIDFQKLAVAIRNALQLREMTTELRALKERMIQEHHFENIVSSSGEMQEVFRLLQKVKDTEIPVLVLGESGTGKELVSRAIHFNGKRKEGPFIVVNCASIPHDLLESELFGHEKGAFTGAYQRRIGKFEQAAGGTIFLDEIGEMDFSLQAKLLRVIQNREFERVGGSELLKADVRLISATNRDLHAEVKARRFREDLYFRLAAFPIILPPLRQRKSDILSLAEHFLRRFSEQLGKPHLRFSRNTLKLLYEYPWPGNVRELENVIQRAVVMAEGKEIGEQELPLAMQSFTEPDAAAPNNAPLFGSGSSVVPLAKIKEAALRHALSASNGNIAEAASRLNIGRATLYRLMKKYGITT